MYYSSKNIDFNRCNYTDPIIKILILEGVNVKKTILTTFIFIFSSTAYAEHGDDSSLLELPLEGLMQQQVSSISKKLQKIENTPAAAYVITAKDIERSGATSIPEVLRLAPGVDVAAIGNNKWAVSIRGFNSRLASKVLVMLDGRAIYPTVYPGTLWENNDIPLALIERVEVLRGPGAAIWGNNAMNGVINIITKSSHDTMGGELGLTFGSEQKGITSSSYSWALDQNTSFRVHGNARKTDSAKLVSGGAGHDDWESQNIGFRLDKELPQGRILFQGGVFNSQTGDRLTAPRFDGGVDVLTSDKKNDSAHLQLIWDYEADNGVLHTLQGFAEYANADIGIVQFRTKTVDLEYQQQLTLGQRQDLIWGIGYRVWENVGFETPYSSLKESDKVSHFASFFIQDDISLTPNTLTLTLGARLEQRTNLDRELQPNIRLLWTPDEINNFWAAVSRTIRMPTVAESDSRLAVLGPSPETSMLPVIRELSSLSTEKLTAFDIGWRRQWHENFSTDIAGFIYHYDDLLGLKILAPAENPPLSLPLMVVNNGKIQQMGVELSAAWQPEEDWQIKFHYSWLHGRNKSGDLAESLDSSSKYKVSLQVTHEINQNLEWTAFLRYVDKVTVVSPSVFGGYKVPAYISLDLRLKYKLDTDLDISLVGQNLLEPSHKEYIDAIFISPAIEIQRGVYLKLDWRF